MSPNELVLIHSIKKCFRYSVTFFPFQLSLILLLCCYKGNGTSFKNTATDSHNIDQGLKSFAKKKHTAEIPINLALKKPAKQSSEYEIDDRGKAENAVDGITDGRYSEITCSHTATRIGGWHWWMVDLQENYTINSIRIYNRIVISERLQNFTVEVSTVDPQHLEGFPQNVKNAEVCKKILGPVPDNGPYDYQCDKPVRGRYVRVVKKSHVKSPLTLCEFEVYETPFFNNESTTTRTETNASDSNVSTKLWRIKDPQLPMTKKSEKMETSESINVALKKPAKQSSNYSSTSMAEKAVDGISDGLYFRSKSCTHTKGAKSGWHWWMVDLQGNYTINYIRIYNRAAFSKRLQNFAVEVSMEDPQQLTGFPQNVRNAGVCKRIVDPVPANGPHDYQCDNLVNGRYVRVIKQSPGVSALTLCEFEVYGTPFLDDESKERKATGLKEWMEWRTWMKEYIEMVPGDDKILPCLD